MATMLPSEWDSVIQRDKNPLVGSCIDISSATNSIWLSGGRGLLFRRRMTAYAKVRLYSPCVLFLSFNR